MWRRLCHTPNVLVYGPQTRFSMNRYPLWKYAVILVALLIGAIYALPNL